MKNKLVSSGFRCRWLEKHCTRHHKRVRKRQTSVDPVALQIQEHNTRNTTETVERKAKDANKEKDKHIHTKGMRRKGEDGRTSTSTRRRRRATKGGGGRSKADSTPRYSRAVPHPSTNRALRRLTSEVRRDPVHSTRYGRRRKQRTA